MTADVADRPRTQMGLNGLMYFLQPDGTQGAIENKFWIVDPKAFSEKEYGVTMLVRLILNDGMEKLVGCPRRATVEAEMRDVHRALFTPLFSWAGRTRWANVAKINPANRRRTRFSFIPSLGDDPRRLTAAALKASQGEFAERFSAIDGWLNGQRVMDRRQHLSVITRLFKELNDLHPFPEGNGRATRIMLERQSMRHGYLLNFSGVEKDEWINASEAAAEGKILPMMGILGRCSIEVPKDLTEIKRIRDEIVAAEKNMGISGFYMKAKP